MKTAVSETLSTIPTVTVPRRRTTPQLRTTLTFIHRFRHITTKHLQSCLGHASLTQTNLQLSLLRAKGYTARHYDSDARATNHAAQHAQDAIVHV